MSVKRRFMNVARLEAMHAAARLRTAASGWIDSSLRPGAPEARGDDLDADYARIRREVEAELQGVAPGAVAAEAPPEIRRFYANLELPDGASLDEVKAAYRRLMRRYHPDKHHGDPERAAAATRLAHELRQAYEGLLRHLKG